MKKILFITKNMACGGVERTLLNLLSVLQPDKYSVNLLLLDKSGDFLNLVPDNVRILEVDMPERWRTILKLSDLSLKHGVKKIWKSGKYLFAIDFFLLRLTTRLLSKICKQSILYRICLSKIKLPSDDYDIICDYHGYGYMTTYLASSFKSAKKYSWIHIEKIDEAFLYARKLYYNFDAFFGVSSECLNNFSKAFPEIESERLILLHNVVSKDQICDMSLLKPLVEYDINEKFFIVSVGRLSTQKGFDLAINSAEILKRHGRKFLWLIIGEGPERSNLEERIIEYGLENKVILHGLDKNPYSYMLLANLYVQCSRFEGFATTLTEAIILNKPIVTTSFSGVDQQVIDGKNGLLAAFNSSDLAKKIEYMMDDYEFRENCEQYSANIKLPIERTLSMLETFF